MIFFMKFKNQNDKIIPIKIEAPFVFNNAKDVGLLSWAEVIVEEEKIENIFVLRKIVSKAAVEDDVCRANK